jgi:hypothetical protein
MLEVPQSLEDLRPDPENPRAISKEAKAGLRKSLEKFGDIAGITWNARTGFLISGHQRLEQLTELGGKLVHDDGMPFIQLPTGDRFRVRVVDWSDRDGHAANASANNTHIGGFFTEELAPFLEDVRIGIGDMEFEELRFDKLMPTDETDEKEKRPKTAQCPECGHEFEL